MLIDDIKIINMKNCLRKFVGTVEVKFRNECNNYKKKILLCVLNLYKSIIGL